jgi:hypothetical protein
LQSKAFFRKEGDSLLFNSLVINTIFRIRNNITEEIRKGYPQDIVAKEQQKVLQERFS